MDPTDKRQRALEIFSLAWAFALALLLVVHFSVTAIWVAPSSPLRLSLLPFTARYIEPFFTQTWTLFAPDPLRSSDYIYVSCRIQGVNGASFETPARDVTSRLYEAHYANRLGPANRLFRTQVRPLFMIAGQKDELTEYILSQQDAPPEDLRKLVEDVVAQTTAGYEAGVRALVRVASAECARLYPHSIVTHVNPRWVLVEPPSFTERARPLWEGKIKRIDFGWNAFQGAPSYVSSQS